MIKKISNKIIARLTDSVAIVELSKDKRKYRLIKKLANPEKKLAIKKSAATFLSLLIVQHTAVNVKKMIEKASDTVKANEVAEGIVSLN
jgi:hypothetical protein